MPSIDHKARPAGPPDDDDPPSTWRRRLVRLRADVEDWLWNPDEKFAAERGWTSRRSARGCAVQVRNPAFDRRHLCSACDGTGRHRITGAGCPDCDGTGVVTDPEEGGRR